MVVYAVPTHKLGSELVERFAEEAIHARVYRGYEADDPDQPGMVMCHDLAAVTDAQKAGASIKGAVCEQKRPDGETLRCEHFHACGMMPAPGAAAGLDRAACAAVHAPPWVHPGTGCPGYR